MKVAQKFVDEKYVSVQKKRIYSCFVDYAKAFDTVCREALLYKLWKLQIQGKFFDCLEDMYTNSTAKIKLLNKLSCYQRRLMCFMGPNRGTPCPPSCLNDLYRNYRNSLIVSRELMFQY